MSKPKLNQPDIKTKSILSYESAYEYLLGLLELEDDIKWPLVKQSMQRFKELINLHSQPDPTLEEVTKEWEELGYEWKDNGKYYILTKYYRKCSDLKCIKDSILIWKDNKDYEKRKESITIQEHQLLTKTFRALGWEV